MDFTDDQGQYTGIIYENTEPAIRHIHFSTNGALNLKQNYIKVCNVKLPHSADSNQSNPIVISKLSRISIVTQSNYRSR